MNFNVATTTMFMKTLLSLTNKEQKSVVAAIDHWRENPENTGSNFEKLNHPNDNIYSIRVNDTWRVIMAKFDDTYFLLHTGVQHDKTNNWAKNKKIDRNIMTGAFQIYSVNVREFEERLAQEQPVSEEAGPFEGITRNELLILGVPEEWLESVWKVKTDNHFYDLIGFLPNDAAESLGLIYTGEGDLRILIEQNKTKIATKPENLIDQIKIQPGFYVLGEDSSLMDVLHQDVNIFRFYLHPAQRLYATGNFKGSMKITGSAGTGKTVVAMHRAKYLLEKLKPEDKPIFFTTFTRHLIKNIKSLFAGQKMLGEQLHVNNLHSFALEYGKQLGAFDDNIQVVTDNHKISQNWKSFVQSYPAISWPANFLKEEYEQVIQQNQINTLEDYLKISRSGRGEGLNANARTSVWKALKTYENHQTYLRQYSFDDLVFKLNNYLAEHPEERPFSHIICDEIQDFSNLEMRLLRNLVEEKPNDLFLCGDPFQNIYQKKLNFIQAGINIRGKRSYRLTVNYRTTEEIRKYAVDMLNGYSFDDFSGKKPSMAGDRSILNGEDPQYLLFNDDEELKGYILDYIRQSFGNLRLHEICITARTNKEVDKIASWLSEAMYPVIKLNEIESIKDANDKVVLGSMHSLKGLEFKNLIVTGFDKASFPYKPNTFNRWSEEAQQQYLKSEHALYYVAFSRAISQLVVTGIGEQIE